MNGAFRLGVAAASVHSGGGGTDPYWDETILLLHFDGSENSTVFTDSSQYGQTVTGSGSPRIRTAQSRFGPSSMRGAGHPSSLGVALNSVPSNAYNWTVEFWVRPPAGMAASGLLYIPSNAIVVIESGLARFVYAGFNRISSGALTVDTWHHVAVSAIRPGSISTIRLFVGGALIGSYDSGAADLALPTSALNIGQRASIGFTGLDAYFDDYRLTAACRYTANFTPPSAPFPNA